MVGGGQTIQVKADNIMMMRCGVSLAGLPVTLHEITWDGGMAWDDALRVLQEWKKRNVVKPEEDEEGHDADQREEEVETPDPELSSDERLTGFFK